MAFFGVFGESREARARFEGRAVYLSASALHFSIDGRVALCHDSAKTLDALARSSYLFFVATSSEGRASLGGERLSLLFRRYGKRLRPHIPCPCAFALYDPKRGMLFLGGAHDEKCFMEVEGDTVFFSSDPHLLRFPIPVDFAILK